MPPRYDNSFIEFEDGTTPEPVDVDAVDAQAILNKIRVLQEDYRINAADMPKPARLRKYEAIQDQRRKLAKLNAAQALEV